MRGVGGDGGSRGGDGGGGCRRVSAGPKVRRAAGVWAAQAVGEERKGGFSFTIDCEMLRIVFS